MTRTIAFAAALVAASQFAVLAQQQGRGGGAPAEDNFPSAE